MDYKINPSIDGIQYINITKNEYLGQGATGQVYKINIGDHKYAVKINHNKNSFNKEKIQFMVNHKPDKLYINKDDNTYPLFSWPLSTLCDLNTNPIGFVMPLIDEKKSKTLDFFYDYTLSKRLNSSSSVALSFKIKILSNLCESISNLHKQGVFLIDLKPQNMRVFEGTNVVTLLDCDSFKIDGSKNNLEFPGEMVSPGYISPELLKANLSPSQMNIQQDLYALAVIIFQMLNKGIHPFQGILADKVISANTDDEKAAAGLYPYGLERNPKIHPKKESIHEALLTETRMLFDRAFLQQGNRPTAEEWLKHLRIILEDKKIIRCSVAPNNIRHMHFKNHHCPVCREASPKTEIALQNLKQNNDFEAKNPKSITKFSDISHIYGITDPVYAHPQSSSGVMKTFYLSFGIISLVLFGVFVYSNNSDVISSSYNNYVNKSSVNTDANYQGSTTSYEDQDNYSNTKSQSKSKKRRKKNK